MKITGLVDLNSVVLDSDMDELLAVANMFVEHGWGLKRALEAWGAVLIQAALKRSGRGGRAQNKCVAANMLGIHRNTLDRRL